MSNEWNDGHLSRVTDGWYEPERAPTLNDLCSFGPSVFPGFSEPGEQIVPNERNVQEIAALLDGYSYRLHHGPTPPVLFNGVSPYAKALGVEGGQNCRISWEMGWCMANMACKALPAEPNRFVAPQPRELAEWARLSDNDLKNLSASELDAARTSAVMSREALILEVRAAFYDVSVEELSRIGWAPKIDAKIADDYYRIGKRILALGAAYRQKEDDSLRDKLNGLQAEVAKLRSERDRLRAICRKALVVACDEYGCNDPARHTVTWSDRSLSVCEAHLEGAKESARNDGTHDRTDSPRIEDIDPRDVLVDIYGEEHET